VKTGALKGVKVRHGVRHGRRFFILELRWLNPPLCCVLTVEIGQISVKS
jgi:hypothetical protein